ncbi:MAG: hypothetical protein IJF90_11505 [Synergistaceae bacterium]|nr:hypothetical protein [Synergistaceae bacterium]
MARPYFTAKHVESMSLLPQTLEVGRAYFVDDEQVIVIDHGRGPVIYGGATGPQGAAGEPIPQLQEQIDSLVAQAYTTQKTIWDINKRELDRHEQIQEIIENVKTEIVSAMQSQRDDLTEAMQEQADRMDSALNILAKSIANLYPEHYAPEDSQDDPLDNETVSTPAGTWVIQQTTLKDGTVVLNLEAQDLVIDTIQIGDTVDFDGSTWTVEDVSTIDGTTSITIRP